MTVPNANLAKVDREKIVEYLLNPSHPDNGGKAKFFAAAGFTRQHWEVLAAALCKMVLNASVSRSIESSHGSKYLVDGELVTSDGQTVGVRTVWIVERGAQAPRLITAYPAPK